MLMLFTYKLKFIGVSKRTIKKPGSCSCFTSVNMLIAPLSQNLHDHCQWKYACKALDHCGRDAVLILGKHKECSVKRKKHLTHVKCFFPGGDEEDRTLDLTDANRTLSQLSYAPI